MEEYEIFVIARTLHVLAVVVWIGGVAFVTTVLIPSLKRTESPKDRLQLFERLEGRFSTQAKITTAITGLSGVYLLHFMNAWERYLHIQFWWMHLMTFIWIVFSVILFILEPLFLHRFFHALAQKDGEKAFSWLLRMHQILLALSLLAIFGAVAGSHGLSFTR